MITAIIDLGSIFALSISDIFIQSFCPRVGFWNFLAAVAFIFFACSSSPSLAASRNTFTFFSSADSRSCPVRGFRGSFWVHFFHFELRSPLPLLRRFLFHLYYHYFAIPNQELVRGQCLHLLYHPCINY